MKSFQRGTAETTGFVLPSRTRGLVKPLEVCRGTQLKQAGAGGRISCDPKLQYHFAAGYDGREKSTVSQREEDDRATHWKLYSR